MASDETVAWIRRLVGAWDCCATCAGGVLAERDRRVRAASLREAADDQEWWLTEAMDGDFLLVDCGHVGHTDGQVGLGDAKPTDVTRWAGQWLRERADREEPLWTCPDCHATVERVGPEGVMLDWEIGILHEADCRGETL